MEEKMTRIRITKERFDLCDLVSAAIKATYNTRSLVGVERCIDVLNHLKSLSLSVKDIQLFSESISKLETLRRHRNPKIRKEAQALFHSWLKTIYTQGKDRSFKAAVIQARLKEKKIEKETKNDLLALKQKESDKAETYEENDVKRETKKEDVTTKKKKLEVARNQKMCSVAATALPHYSRQNIKDRDRQVTTKTLIPPPRRVAAEPTKDSTNPKSEKELKNKKVDEMVELFEKAKKAADVANAKGVLYGKPEASRCVEALSLLMKFNITPKPKEPRRMMARLEGLTTHKDRKICHAASALLHLWRQRIREQEC